MRFVLRNPASAVLGVSAALLLLGCEGESPTTRALSTVSTNEAAHDSAAFLASRSERIQQVQPLASGVEIFAGDQVTIIVTTAECASQGTVLSVSGPVSGIISSDACRGTGASVTLGPSPADGHLSFVMDDPRFGPGAFQYSGSYPSYTVYMEDGYGDGDFNDAVLSVEMSGGDPELTCSATERGQPVVCTVTPASAAVESWRFRGGRATVTAPGGSNRWEGTAVIGGDVEADVRHGGTQEILRASFAVQNRSWQWGPADFSYQEGAAPMVGGGDIAPAIEVSWLAGWNCTLPDCERGWIVPDLAKGESGGYTIGEGGGPNQGFFYIESASFRIERGSNVNPNIQPGASWTFALSASDASACTSIAPQPDGSVAANWYDFNRLCHGLAMDAWLAAVHAHEGYGTHGNNGHQSQGENEALKTGNDPKRLIEDLYTRDRQDLENRVVREVTRAESRIARAGGREPTTNHPAQNMWSWSYNRDRWVRFRMRPL